MSLRSKVKTNGRRAVTQNYIKALSVTLIVLCVLLLFAVFVAVVDRVILLFGSRLTQSGILAAPGVFEGWGYVFSPIVVLLSLFFEWVLFSPLALGTARWFYRLSGGEAGDVIDLFDFFSGARRYFGALWMELNLFVRRFLYSVLFLAVPSAILIFGAMVLSGAWGMTGPVASVAGAMLLIAGGVLTAAALLFAWVFLKRYALARYLYAQEDDVCTVRQAVRQSRFFMKGHKTELFVFDLSFIGWFLACVLVIPMFYVAPYYLCANALYARILIERGRLPAGGEAAAQEPTQEFDSAPEDEPEQPQ